MTRYRFETEAPVDRTVPVNRSRIMTVDELTFAQVPHFDGMTSRPLRLTLMRPRVPEGRTLPVLLFLCGGAWRTMDKDLWMPELVPLARRGFAVASAEYRTSESACFPAQLEDVKSAIRYLRAHAGRWQLDTDRFAVMGESAGGHLAAMAGVTGTTREFDTGDFQDQSSAVQAVVDYYGPSDFSAMSAFPTDFDHDAPMSPESLLIGGAVQEHPDRVRAASPLTYVTADTPPFLLLHGTEDRTVPCDQSERMFRALKDNGVPAAFYRLTGEGHATDAFVQPEIMELVAGFLMEVLD